MAINSNDDYKALKASEMKKFLGILEDIKGELSKNDIQYSTFRIDVDRDTRYRQVGDGDEKSISASIDSESLNKLEKAIRNPESLKDGSIRIYAGNKVVHNVLDGTVHKSELSNLRSQVKSEHISRKAEQPSSLGDIKKQVKSVDRQVQEQERQVNSQEALNTLGVQSEKTLQSINKLQETVQKQQEMINKLTESLENVSNTNNPNPENSALQNFVGVVERKFKEFARGVLNEIKQSIQPVIDAVKSKIDGIKNKIGNAQTAIVEDAKKGFKIGVHSVASKILETKAKDIEKSINVMLNLVGGENNFSSKSYDFKWNKNEAGENEIVITRKSDNAKIFGDGKFTSEVLQQDLDNIEKVESVLQEYASEVAESQQQEQSRGISR